MSETKPPYEGDMRVLFPGTFVPFDPAKPDGEGARVYPVRAVHIRKYSKALFDALMQGLGKINWSDKSQPLDMDTLRNAFTGIAPVMGDSLWELVCECTVPHPDDLPHWVLPSVGTAFLQENFFEEKKIRPWLQAMEVLVEKITGERFSISETFSKDSSPADIRSTVSSIRSKLGLTDNPSRTEDGRSPSSGTGSSAASDSSSTVAAVSSAPSSQLSLP